MNEAIDEEVSVISKFDKPKGTFLPVKLRWLGKDRVITKVGFHYKKLIGKKLLHFFTVTDGNIAYYLSLDTENLHWTLLEITDGNG